MGGCGIFIGFCIKTLLSRRYGRYGTSMLTRPADWWELLRLLFSLFCIITPLFTLLFIFFSLFSVFPLITFSTLCTSFYCVCSDGCFERFNDDDLDGIALSNDEKVEEEPDKDEDDEDEWECEWEYEYEYDDPFE